MQSLGRVWAVHGIPRRQAPIAAPGSRRHGCRAFARRDLDLDHRRGPGAITVEGFSIDVVPRRNGGFVDPLRTPRNTGGTYMRLAIILVAVFAGLATPTAWAVEGGEIILRGDANLDDRADLSDAMYILNWLNNGGPEPGCLAQADANDDGVVNNSDASYLTNWLYQGGAEPPPPSPSNPYCMEDEYPSPGCNNSPCA
jgi:hypothetical protein